MVPAMKLKTWAMVAALVTAACGPGGTTGTGGGPAAGGGLGGSGGGAAGGQGGGAAGGGMGGAGGGGGSGGGMAVPPKFEPDALPAGATLFLKADLSDPKVPKLEVWVQGLAPVLGVAFHLGLDETQLRVDAAGCAPAMGPDGRYLQKARGGDVAFGLAKLGGETDLTAPTKIATVTLAPLKAVDQRPTLTQVQARKADGTFVSLKAVTGKVVIP